MYDLVYDAQPTVDELSEEELAEFYGYTPENDAAYLATVANYSDPVLASEPRFWGDMAPGSYEHKALKAETARREAALVA